MRTPCRWFINVLLLIAAGCLLTACGGDDNVAPTVAAGVASPTAMTSAGGAQAMRGSDCAPEVNERGFMNADNLKARMACVVPLFPWPEGKLPNRALIERFVESHRGWETAGFEAGMEFSQIAGYNACAWIEEWLEARQDGDARRETTALGYLLTLVPDPAASIPGFPDGGYDISTTEAYLQMAERAELGDPAPVQEYATQCSWIDWTAS